MKRLYPILCLSALAFTVYLTNQTLDKHRTPERALQETLYLPDGKVLKMVSLGYTSLLADILWIKSVIYYGKNSLDEDNPFYYFIKQNNIDTDILQQDRAVKINTNELQHEYGIDFSQDIKLARHHIKDRDFQVANFLYPLLQRVAELEPHFLSTYEFGGLVVLKQTGAVHHASRLLNYGLQMNPDKWELPFQLGYIELFYNGNNESAIRWLSQAIALPDAPGFVSHLYQSFMENQKKPALYINYLKGLYKSTTNEKVRNNILELLENLDSIGSIDKY